MERSWGKPLSYKSDPKKKLTFLVKYFNYNNELHYVKLKFVATEWTTPQKNIYFNSSVIVKKSSPKNLSADCWSTVGRQVTDSLPTANQQVTDRLRKKKNCVKNEQLTWHNNP